MTLPAGRYPRSPCDASGTRFSLLKLVTLGSRVLDVGWACRYCGKTLTGLGFQVWGRDIDSLVLDAVPHETSRAVAQVDLGALCAPSLAADRNDVVLAAVVLKHLVKLERPLERLPGILARARRFIGSLPNLAHLSVELFLLVGRFDYGGLVSWTWGRLHHLRFRVHGVSSRGQGSGSIWSWADRIA